MGFLKATAVVLALGVLLIWGARSLPSYDWDRAFTGVPQNQAGAAASVESPLVPAEDGPASYTGTVVIDDQVTPEMPYLVYTLADGEVRTKQLIFSGARGCDIQAGDLPCVMPAGWQYPKLSPGERIRVEGRIVGDQMFVDEIVPA